MRKRRAAPISYRPPAELRAEFEQRVLSSGLCVNAFLTRAVFERDPPRRARRTSADAEAIGRLLVSLGALRGSLDRMAGRLAGRGGSDAPDSAAVEAALMELNELRAACFIALGRKP